MKVLKNEKGVDVECEIGGGRFFIFLRLLPLVLSKICDLEGILRFMLTVNEQAFDSGQAVRGLKIAGSGQRVG